ncbi:hypothetical protein [Halanaerobium salsuginis]|jgi:hypothetical protein|uniref:RES domain-containing protein n=1 Tax=Halanaerobium salsuginis TaxID=29563 RepID=A0A1I4MBF4_9FIRM|nr:hypothetical protein [Halanaerobium salsuginis]SFM00528.1 hypothetical protein SAMN02983006_02561 [Halanaerobium salsuginis]
MKDNIKNIKVFDSVKNKIEGSIKVEAGDTRTGRKVVHYDSKDPGISEARKKLEKLIKDFVELGKPDLETYLAEIVSKFRCKTNLKQILCYRGLSIESESNLNDKYIGPAPKEYITDNRYNSKNENCLYLIDDNKFIKEEICKENWLEQKYEIPLSDYKIADLSVDNNKINNILKLAFYMSEKGRTNSGYNIESALQKRGKSKYLYSQLLAKLFKKYKWDGFFIAGVRGRKKEHYNNIVIFESIIRDWQEWISGQYYYHKSI